MLNIKRSEVRFLKELHRREFSSLFHVIVREQECVLKVVSYINLYRSGQ